MKQTLKEIMKEKIWNLHIETMERGKTYTPLFRKAKKYSKKKKYSKEAEKDQKKAMEIFMLQNQQIGKIIFLSWLLSEIGEKKLVDKIWRARDWKMSSDGNYVISRKQSEKTKIRKNKHL